MVGQDLHCPKCGEMDMVQKVSAVYSGGTASGSYAGPTGGAAVPIGGGKPAMVGGYTTLVGSSQTYLSRRLTPPQKPSSSGISVLVVLFAIGLFWVAGLCGLLGLGEIKTGGAFGLLIALITGVLGIGILALANSSAKQSAAKAAAAMPHWEKAIERWNELYYCGRDDIIFIPGETQFERIENLRSFIYM